MSDTTNRRLLVVANLTESTPRLLEEIDQRAHSGCDFKLMVPPERHPDAPDWSTEEALRLVGRAAGDRPVELVSCGDDAALTIATLVADGAADEILLCTPAEHHARWHHHSLPKRLQEIGVPVTVIPPDSSGWSFAHGYPNDWMRIEVGPLT